MGWGRVIAGCVVLAAVLTIAGCGSSGSGTSAESATGTLAEHPARLTSGGKGELPGEEPATKIHLTAADCKALGGLAEEGLGTKLASTPTPKPPLSKCRIEGHGAEVNVYLDTGYAANRRYRNRMTETAQFNSQHPSGLARQVPHVGEKSYGNSAASWIPAQGSLLAVRGNRWLTVTIAVHGLADKQLEAEAATLARAGFKLTGSG